MITNAELQITDVDNTPGQLTYTMTAALLNGRLELTMPTSVMITIFTQANIDAGRVVFTHGGAAVTSESFTFTVSDGGGIGGSGGTGSGSGSGSGTGGGIAPPSIQLPFLPISTEALITNVSEVRGTEDPAPRVVMANQTFVRVEQPNTVAQEQATVSAEPLSPLGEKIRAVGQKLVERLTKLANDLERGVQEQEHKAQLIGQVASYSGMALFAGFVAWIRLGGALVKSLLVSMPAWRHLDPLPVLGGGELLTRRKRNRKMREDDEQEKRQFRSLGQFLKSSDHGTHSPK